MARRVRRQYPAYRDDIGDLVTRRPVPSRDIDQLDMFLFLNHHGPQRYAPNNRELPFGPHPHRGFETVTFILEGELAHRDSGGHESVIGTGGVQWMTAAMTAGGRVSLPAPAGRTIFCYVVGGEVISREHTKLMTK